MDLIYRDIRLIRLSFKRQKDKRYIYRQKLRVKTILLRFIVLFLFV